MTVAVDHNALLGTGGGSGPSSTSSASPGSGNHSGAVPRIDPTLPQVFGRYLLVQRLSRGGMGEIFLAKHGLQGFEKLSVVKKVLPNLAEDESFISRFVDEAQVAIKLQHVNIAQVFEVGRVGDEYFLAIEYVEGRDLRRTLQVMARQRRRFPPELALFIGREIANGLAYAHRRTGVDGSSLNLVHCDISPPNVLVSFEGETKIIDFGIAKSALRATATDPKMGFGKFGYMAPEQLIRGGVVDHRTDIYAAGVVLHELLTGDRLYELGQEGAPDYRALARAVSRGEHDLPSDLDPALGRFDDLVARALRPKLDDRYQTAAEFRDAIQTALVQISPTISADQLGAFMREVFTEEMNAHRELVDRVSHLHLDDFKAQLTTQSVATVSFALANMPLVAPPEAIARPPARKGQRSTAVAGMMMTESGPAPSVSGTGTIALGDVDLVPGDPTLTAGRRRSWPIVAITASVVIAGVVAIAVATRSSGSRTRAAAVKPSAQTGASQVPPRPPVVVPVPVGAGIAASGLGDASAGASEDTPPVAADVAIDPEPGTQTERKVAVKVEPRTPKRSRPEAKPEPKPDPEPRSTPASAVDSAAVSAKFKAVSREYREFKQAYGARLDTDWTDLATFAQYAMKSPDKLQQLDKKIDRFRARMQSQR
jgi:eukaryotic-like serine/threonine-protein kinase